MSDKSIFERILEANKKEHDIIAKNHNLNVPYYNRKSTKERYKKLILNSFEKSIDNKNPKKISVLELGCGTGEFSKFFKGKAKYLGIDISPEMIKIAKKFNSDSDINFEASPIESLFKSDQKFDFIFCSSFLHHLHDLSVFKNNLKLILKNKSSRFLALHEPIIPKKQSYVEKLDIALAILEKNQIGEFPLPIRLMYVLTGFFNTDVNGEVTPWFDLNSFISKISKLKRIFDKDNLINKNISGSNQSNSIESELVDYQLLGDFNSALNQVFKTDKYVYSIHSFAQKQPPNYYKVDSSCDEL